VSDPSDSITRRSLLGHAPGAGAVLSALASAAQSAGTPARIYDSFDFGWKFFKGDAEGAQLVHRKVPAGSR
jgi:hypothetical protein